MIPIEDVLQFLETWQATLQEATIIGCTFTDVLFGASLETWSTFITTEGGVDDLIFIDLFSNIL